MNSGVSSDRSGSTSSSLLGRVRQCDPNAWKRLIQIYGPLVYRWARRAGLNDCDAADIAQEVFRTVAERIASFEHRPGEGSFRGWLWTITRNKVGTFFRRQADGPRAAGGTDAQQRLEQIPQELPHETLDDDDRDSQARLVQRALRLIEQDFEPQTWQAFWRATIDGHAVRDIAQDLHMTAVAVRQAKFRVLRRLRCELEQLLD